MQLNSKFERNLHHQTLDKKVLQILTKDVYVGESNILQNEYLLNPTFNPQIQLGFRRILTLI